MEQAVLAGNSKVSSLLYNDKPDKGAYLAGEEDLSADWNATGVQVQVQVTEFISLKNPYPCQGLIFLILEEVK